MELMQAIYHRRAVRDYLDRRVDSEMILRLLDAAAQAPSAVNVQPWAIVIVQDRAMLRRYSDRANHMDAYLAIRGAFRAARRELEDYVRRMRRQVKAHGAAPHGRTERIVPWADHGFITAANRRELYFHRNSLLHAECDRLHMQDELSFTEEPGEKGADGQVRTAAGSGGINRRRAAEGSARRMTLESLFERGS